jgi:hypothetical protein
LGWGEKVGGVRMKAVWLFVIIVVICPGCLLAEVGSNLKAVDEKIVKEVDVTGDGKPDKIILQLKAKDVKAPFTWTLAIIAEDKQIYSYTSDDKWLDEFFNDEGYVENCQGYTDCKQKYYFHDILDSLVLTGDAWFDITGILDPSSSNTLYPLGRKELKDCCNIEGKQADGILGKIEKNLRSGKAIAINVLCSPVKANPPMIYAPEIDRFIKIYEE